MTRPPQPSSMNRRTFLATTAVVSAGVAAAPAARAGTSSASDTFTYEIVRTDAEWRDQLTKAEYKILRDFSTELPHTSPLAKETADGMYHCKGCQLPAFASNWKVPLDKGWVFFAHAQENAVLTSIDGPQEAYGMDPDGFGNMIEVHCRRCGSHLGHHLLVSGQSVYCINGTALNFEATTA